MANKKISDLIAGSALVGTELFEGEVGGASRKFLASQIATYITALIVDSAPSTLDTLNELAAALGDDPNFATTVSNALAARLVAANNLSDVPNKATARANLGLAIGTDVQAFDTDLAAIALLSTTTFGRSLLELSDAAAGRTAFGLGSIATAGATDYRLSPPIPSGRYVYPGGTGTPTSSATAPGADTLKLYPAYIRKNVTINALSVRVATLFAGGNVKAAIYAMCPSSEHSAQLAA